MCPKAAPSFFFKHPYQLGAVFDVQFFIDKGERFFYGDFRHVHFSGDFFIGSAFHDEADDAHFTGGEFFAQLIQVDFFFQNLPSRFKAGVHDVFQQGVGRAGFEVGPAGGKAVFDGEEGDDEVVRLCQAEGFFHGFQALGVFVEHVAGDGLVEEGVDFAYEGAALAGQFFVAAGRSQEGSAVSGVDEPFVFHKV